MLGDRLAEMRAKCRWTQQDVANKLEISRGTSAHYEINKREPDNATLIKLASLFDVSVDCLLGRDGHAPTETSSSREKTAVQQFVPSPDHNPLGIELTPNKLEFLREISKDPHAIFTFKDFANSTPEDRRMLLDIWRSIKRRGKDGK